MDCGLLWCFYQTLILTAPIHCRASIDFHSDGTHSLQSIHWLSLWWHPFTAEHPLTLILTAPIHFHYWDTFLQIWWRNTLILISDDPRRSTLNIFYFWLNFKLSTMLNCNERLQITEQYWHSLPLSNDLWVLLLFCSVQCVIDQHLEGVCMLCVVRLYIVHK